MSDRGTDGAGGTSSTNGPSSTNGSSSTNGPSGTSGTDVDPDVARALAVVRDDAVRRLTGLTEGFDELVAASRDSNADDEHDPEGATIAFERSQLDSLVARARHQLAEVDAARDRLARGRYGTCETCGRPIAAARLEALPLARTCIGCASGRR
ncbi:TraR/DksA C4-type zinc finger protein [Cellulomonas sp. ATA003]|uniref:TraR/DksA family transcriptional regulator n=1 Tax=Cellulomonas sp. ATA003 TaxID=3073064 RepID=UPI002873A04F|nr:TraR/DksA C4-type zinc finger protein [Cellulomonas sp. ATA003]WNB87178.1 TraR/DksA C4-type zinc finger protein [Cellulomonas sp. ATA003]